VIAAAQRELGPADPGERRQTRRRHGARELDRALLALVGPIQLAQVPIADRHVMVALGEPADISQSLVRGNGELVHHERIEPPAADVGDLPEVVDRARDEERVVLLLPELHRAPERELGAIELPELELRGAPQIHRAPPTHPIATALDVGERPPQPRLRLARPRGAEQRLADECHLLRLGRPVGEVAQ